MNLDIEVPFKETQFILFLVLEVIHEEEEEKEEYKEDKKKTMRDRHK